MEKVCAIVLAAGDGKRMRSSRPKVLCEVLFRPMICWIAGVLEECGVRDVCAVLGTGADQVHAAVPRFSWVEQKERLGTVMRSCRQKLFCRSIAVATVQCCTGTRLLRMRIPSKSLSFA